MINRKLCLILLVGGILQGKLAPANAAPPSPSKTSKVAAAAKPATSKPGAKPAAKTAPQVVNRVAVMKFAGPEIYDVDVDEVWKGKMRTSEPTRGELARVTDSLQSALTQRLAQRLGNLVVPAQELKQALGNAPLTVSTDDKPAQLPKSLRAKYVVSGRIERLEFDGNTILEDVYVLFPAAKIVEVATGQEVWSCPIKKYRKKSYTMKTGKTVPAVFADLLIPDIADDLSSQIAQALGK